MIWIDCNPQAGREMRDRHPFLVLSPRKLIGLMPWGFAARDGGSCTRAMS
nr:hypothetical protein [Thioalkalivibrio sp.]